MSDKKREIKIERGVTDVNNVLNHLSNVEKSERKKAWLKEYYEKNARRKETND